MNDFLYPSNSNTYEKEPRYKGTSLEQTNLASPLALHYILVPLFGILPFADEILMFPILIKVLKLMINS